MIELTTEQQSAVTMVQNNRISICVGGPGTGKTTVTKEIVKQAMCNHQSVSLCAPSGKAARRLSEATGQEASTIHRLLGAQMENGDFVFSHGESMPLKCDLLICDETSMVANDLMADLLRAVNANKTSILFVGDQDQLPSIGPGSVLRDFLASKAIPHTELTVIHRNSGDIVRSCHQIKQGQTYTPSGTLTPETGQNLRHIEIKRPQDILGTIKALVCDRLPQRGYNPIWDIQVISPTNTRTAMSCGAINKVLQAELNPNPEIDGTIFRMGDKIINTKNKTYDDGYIVNGDIGQVLDINGKYLTIKFFDPDRIVEISKTDNHLLLAYSITCHRFQGSEAPVIIIPVHSAFTFFLNRPWIYTAISRARDICITVGEFGAINHAIGRPANERNTKLKELLTVPSCNRQSPRRAE